ncbi:MAG: hypothetical protein JXA78_08610 [Anaerolineales bacterium]|nr:hypothetical protein [Anaerolineales bacterium]
MLVVAPIGGLGNRMRVVDSSIALSKATGQSLRLIWLLNPSLNCKFDELFILPESIERITYLDMYSLAGKLFWRLCRAYFSRFYDLYLLQADVVGLLQRGERFEELVAGKRVYIATYSSYYPSPQPFAELAPIPPLQARIAAMTAGFGDVIGVHIRRGDNLRSTRYSQTASFIELMSAELSENDDTKFFLATDSPDEEARLKDEFPGRMITYEKTALDRNDPRAAQDALVDLYCLSRCRKLIGSYWSSFTDTAWQINNIERLIIREGTPD